MQLQILIDTNNSNVLTLWHGLMRFYGSAIVSLILQIPRTSAVHHYSGLMKYFDSDKVNFGSWAMSQDEEN